MISFQAINGAGKNEVKGQGQSVHITLFHAVVRKI